MQANLMGLIFHFDLNFGCHASRLREHIWRKTFGIKALRQGHDQRGLGTQAENRAAMEYTGRRSLKTSDERKPISKMIRDQTWLTIEFRTWTVNDQRGRQTVARGAKMASQVLGVILAQHLRKRIKAERQLTHVRK